MLIYSNLHVIIILFSQQIKRKNTGQYLQMGRGKTKAKIIQYNCTDCLYMYSIHNFLGFVLSVFVFIYLYSFICINLFVLTLTP